MHNFNFGSSCPITRLHVAVVGSRRQCYVLALRFYVSATISSLSSYAAKASKIPIGESNVASHSEVGMHISDMELM